MLQAVYRRLLVDSQDCSLKYPRLQSIDCPQAVHGDLPWTARRESLDGSLGYYRL